VARHTHTQGPCHIASIVQIVVGSSYTVLQGWSEGSNCAVAAVLVAVVDMVADTESVVVLWVVVAGTLLVVEAAAGGAVASVV
jgi:hypothetical protein